MISFAFVRRLLLVLAFVAGSWEDILPGVEGLDCREAPFSSPLPDGPMPESDADDDAGDGFVLSQEPPEPLPISEFDVALVRVKGRHLSSLYPQAPSPIVVKHIPHVPKPSFPF